jgi:hypothetical protein
VGNGPQHDVVVEGARAGALVAGREATAMDEQEHGTRPALRRLRLEDVETVRMNRLTRLFTYAICCWVAEIDGQPTSSEASVLQLLGDRLGLSALARDRANNAVRGIAERSAPGAFDLLELRSRLSAGLSQIGDE